MQNILEILTKDKKTPIGNVPAFVYYAVLIYIAFIIITILSKTRRKIKVTMEEKQKVQEIEQKKETASVQISEQRNALEWTDSFLYQKDPQKYNVITDEKAQSVAKGLKDRFGLGFWNFFLLQYFNEDEPGATRLITSLPSKRAIVKVAHFYKKETGNDLKSDIIRFYRDDQLDDLITKINAMKE